MPQDRVSSLACKGLRPDLRQISGPGTSGDRVRITTGVFKIQLFAHFLNRNWMVRFAEATGDFPSPGMRGRPRTGRPFEHTNPFKTVSKKILRFCLVARLRGSGCVHMHGGL